MYCKHMIRNDFSNDSKANQLLSASREVHYDYCEWGRHDYSRSNVLHHLGMLSMIRNSAGYIVNLILTKKFDGKIDSFEYAAKDISYRDITLGKEYDDDYKSKYRCFFTGKNPAVIISFNVKTAEEFATLCGVDIKSIPIELQHYHKNKLYQFGQIEQI